MVMIPESCVFDQRTMTLMVEHDPLVQHYRTFFKQLDWNVVPDRQVNPSRPGLRPHPKSASIKALLIKICEGFEYISQLRRFLLRHPLLVLEIGFRPIFSWQLPYGFCVEKTVPTDHRLRDYQRDLDHRILQDLFAGTVRELKKELPGLGETVAFDVKHIYAWVRENNPRESIKDRFSKENQPKGDPDCKVGVKRSTNQIQADGTRKGEKRILVGIRQWSGSSNDCRLWRRGARRADPDL